MRVTIDLDDLAARRLALYALDTGAVVAPVGEGDMSAAAARLVEGGLERASREMIWGHPIHERLHSSAEEADAAAAPPARRKPGIDPRHLVQAAAETARAANRAIGSGGGDCGCDSEGGETD